jgi:hypothetical protein
VSIKVDVSELADRLGEYGFAYLVTVGDDRRAHLVAATPELVGDELVIAEVGRHSSANAADHPDVTLVWPPRTDGGYSLIVDGRATVAGGVVSVTPARAVLHRPATGEVREGCTADCQPLDLGLA